MCLILYDLALNASIFIQQRALQKFIAVRGGARNFPTGELNLPTRELKYGFQGTINAKNLQKIAFHLPTGG